MAIPRRRPHVSAALFIDQRKLIEELVGVEAVNRAVASLRPDQRAEIDNLLPVSWCSLETSQAFFYATAKEANQDPLVMHRRVTRIGIERTFTTMWRFVLRWTSVDAVLKRASLLFSHSYDTGKMTTQQMGEGHVVGIVSDWPQIPEFEIDAITSGIEVVIQLAGRKSLGMTWKRQPDGVKFDIHFE